MGDRSWNSSYSRSYGSGSADRSRYTSSSGTSNGSYTRSGDHDRHHDNDAFSYTRSSSRYNRDHSNRNKYDDFSRSNNNGESRDSHHHYGSDRDFGNSHDQWRYSRDTDFRTHQVSRNYQAFPERADSDGTPYWSNPVRNPRSPTAYMNPSPPRRSSHRDRLLKSPSPTRAHGASSRFNYEKSTAPASASYSAWGKPNHNTFSTNDRRHRESLEDGNHSKFENHGFVEIDKLTSRLKEYVPWLTSRKACIFESRRDKELKEEVDDIDWCLDVIRDIKSNENVGMQTIKRAQVMVMRLISKGPITSSMVTVTVADNTDTETLEDVIRRRLAPDDYSARSPSPPSILEDAQFTRRIDAVDVAPRVIPTDRDQQYSSVVSMFPPSHFQDKLNMQQAEMKRAQQLASISRDVPIPNPSYNRSVLPNLTPPLVSNPRSIPFDRESDTVPEKVNPIFKDYGHGHTDNDKPALNEALFERRQPLPQKLTDINHAERDSAAEREALAKKALEERRLKEWEESTSDEEDTVQHRWNKALDEDLRSDSGFKTTLSTNERFNEDLRKPGPESIAELSLYGFTPDMINPFKPTNRVQPPLQPLLPKLPGARPQPFATAPRRSLLPQPQPMPQVPLHLLNMSTSPYNFNPFIPRMGSTAATQMLLQRQAQLLSHGPPTGNNGQGLLPLPTGNMLPNPCSRMRFPNANSMEMSSRESEMSDEEIMLSRIRTRAAESFNRGKALTEYGNKCKVDNNSSASLLHGQESTPHLPVPLMGPPAQVLDPRLRPREPREFIPKEPFRGSSYQTSEQLNSEPIPNNSKTIMPEVIELSDSDTDLKIDLSGHQSEPENSDDERDENSTQRYVETQDLPKSSMAPDIAQPLSSPTCPEVPTTESSSHEKSNLPAVADELIKALLFSSLSPEEADVLNSSEEYLTNTLARLKEELSAKVKERTRQMSGESTESCVSNLLGPQGTTPDCKDDEDVYDEHSRSRRTTRRKPQGKRRSSLEKLHDALREMNFDAMLPLGRRRNQAKTSTNEDHAPLIESIVAEKSTDPVKIPLPVLSPVVVLKDCTQTPASANSRSASPDPPRSPVESLDNTENSTRKRRYPRRKRVAAKTVNTRSRKALAASRARNKAKSLKEGPPAKKTRKDLVESEEDVMTSAPIDTPNMDEDERSDDNSTSTVPTLVIDLGKLGEGNENNADEKNIEDLNTKIPGTELMDLGKDLLKNPTEFGLLEDDNSLYKPEDFNLTLSDDDLASIKVDDIDICSADFVIDEAGLEALTRLNPVQSSPEASPSKTEYVKQRGRRRNPPRGVAEEHHCPVCDFSGTVRKMVDHFVNIHPGTTIPQACLAEASVKLLEEVNKSGSPQLMEVQFSVTESIRCIYCNIVVSNISAYCQHLTCHTGEYRFRCSVCDLRFFTRQLASGHCKTHRKEKIQLAECLIEVPLSIDEKENEFYGYMCRECNYFQINADGIRDHLDLTKHCETDVACIRFKAQTKKQNKIKSRPSRSTPTKPLVKESTPPPPRLLPSLPVESPLPSPTPTPPSPEEKLNSIFALPKSVIIPEPPKFESAEISRYHCSKRNRIQLVLRYCESDDDEDDEPVSKEMRLDEPTRRTESKEIVEQSSAATLQWILDAVCCEEEVEKEMQNLAIVVMQSEAAFGAMPVDMDGSLSLRSAADEIRSTDSSDDLDEEEPNDYYVYEDSSSESEHGPDQTTEEKLDEPENDVPEELNKSILDGPSCPSIPGLTLLPSPNSVLFKEQTPSSTSSHQFIHTPSSNSPSSVQQRQEGADVIVDLSGSDLYVCGNAGCDFFSPTFPSFKSHSLSCKFAESTLGYACAHCDRRVKTPSIFYEHIHRHGKPNLWCSLCSFKARHHSEMKRHFKGYHKYNAIKGDLSTLPFSCESMWFPKDLHEKRVELEQVQKNPLLYIPRIQFLPNEIEDIPRSCIMLSEIHCALCTYSTKVRVNMIRHLDLHKRAEENCSIIVPSEAPVNPVPWLERKELMFDKMTNWAGSTHHGKGVATNVKAQFPQFVADQFRYVCSVPSCGQITVDDTMLKAHMRALHSEYDYYQCPHCQLSEATKSNPNYTVPIDKLGAHLKLHGPRLLKCRHCDFISIFTKFMEKHVAEKHAELKPSHHVIRATEEDGGGGKLKGAGSDEEVKKSSVKFRCSPCKLVLLSWELAKEHIQTIHKTKSQFMCDSCQFHTNSIFQLAKHIMSKKCVKAFHESARALVSFSRSELVEENIRYPIWRRVSSREHLRGIYYLQEHELEVETETASNSKSTSVTNVKPTTSVPNIKPLSASPVKPVAAPTAKPSTVVNAKTSTVSKLALATDPRPLPKLIEMPGRRKQTLPPKKEQVMYICCQCGTFKSKAAEGMKTHLRQHLNYHRYTCRLCGNRSWTMNSFKLHVEADHSEPYDANKHLHMEPRNRAIEKQLELWMSLSLQDPLSPDVDEDVIFVSCPEPAKNKATGSFCEEILILD